MRALPTASSSQPQQADAQLDQLIKSVAPTDANVLITGENGCGKEVVATAIHEASKRAKGPFIKVNCAAIPTELIESELFGHKRGAFTGAVNDKQGLMELASNGTLLLDEIRDLMLNLQVKLLRVLQDREFPAGRQHEGAEDELPAHFRHQRQYGFGAQGRAAARGPVLPHQYAHAAGARSSREAHRHSADGRVFPAQGRGAAREGRHVVPRPDALRALVNFAWPGNVRELQHVIERAVILTQGSLIGVDDLPDNVTAAATVKS